MLIRFDFFEIGDPARGCCAQTSQFASLITSWPFFLSTILKLNFAPLVTSPISLSACRRTMSRTFGITQLPGAADTGPASPIIPPRITNVIENDAATLKRTAIPLTVVAQPRTRISDASNGFDNELVSSSLPMQFGCGARW